MKRFLSVLLVAVAAMLGFNSAAYADHGVMHEEQCPAPAPGDPVKPCASFYDGYSGESEKVQPPASDHAGDSCKTTGVKTYEDGTATTGVVVSRDGSGLPSGPGWKDCDAGSWFEKPITYVIVSSILLAAIAAAVAASSNRKGEQQIAL